MSKLSYSAPAARANQYVLLKYEFITPENKTAELKLKLSPMSPARHEELTKNLATKYMMPLMDRLGKVSGLSADKITALLHGTLNESDPDVQVAMQNTFAIQGVFQEMNDMKYEMIKAYVGVMVDGGLDIDEENALDELKFHAFSQSRRTESKEALDNYITLQKKADKSEAKKDINAAKKAFDIAEALEVDEAQDLFEAFLGIQDDYSAKQFENLNSQSTPDKTNVDEKSAVSEDSSVKKS